MFLFACCFEASSVDVVEDISIPREQLLKESCSINPDLGYFVTQFKEYNFSFNQLKQVSDSIYILEKENVEKCVDSAYAFLLGPDKLPSVRIDPEGIVCILLVLLKISCDREIVCIQTIRNIIRESSPKLFDGSEIAQMLKDNHQQQLILKARKEARLKRPKSSR